jgi:hypothetical protein
MILCYPYRNILNTVYCIKVLLNPPYLVLISWTTNPPAKKSWLSTELSYMYLDLSKPRLPSATILVHVYHDKVWATQYLYLPSQNIMQIPHPNSNCHITHFSIFYVSPHDTIHDEWMGEKRWTSAKWMMSSLTSLVSRHTSFVKHSVYIHTNNALSFKLNKRWLWNKSLYASLWCNLSVKLWYASRTLVCGSGLVLTIHVLLWVVKGD